MLGADVSVFQGSLDPWFFDQYEFVIIRAFDRHGNLDARFHENWEKARGRTKRGAYGWPKPGADNRALGANLAAVASDAEYGLWADYEFSPEYGLATQDDLEDYLAGIGSVRFVGVYANIPTYRDHLLGTFADRFPWWVANYGPNNGERNPLSLPAPRPYQIHQFTSRGGPGGSGLDLNWAEEPVSNVWYPGAIHTPGARAGDDVPRNRMEVVKCHYTVGVNSYGIGKQGYFHFLVNRDGTIYQFAPVDAVCWDSSEWNDAGPGIEIEFHPNYHDAIFNDEMRRATRGLVQWLHTEHGFPLRHHSAAFGRIGEFSGFRGFIDHGALIQSSPHHDYWPQEDWAYIAAEGQPKKRKVPRMYIAVGRTIFGVSLAFLVTGDYVMRVFDGSEGAYGIPQSALNWKGRPGTDAVDYVFVEPAEIGQFLELHQAQKPAA